MLTIVIAELKQAHYKEKHRTILVAIREVALAVKASELFKSGEQNAGQSLYSS
jgi:hypothetical protein